MGLQGGSRTIPAQDAWDHPRGRSQDGRDPPGVAREKGRLRLVCVTRNHALRTADWKNAVTLVDRVTDHVGVADEDVMVAGCAQIYKEALMHPSFVRRVHLSVMKGEYTCDAFLPAVGNSTPFLTNLPFHDFPNYFNHD